MVHIVWEHSSPGNGDIGELYYIRSINSGSSFDPDTQLTTEDSHFPSIAVRDSIVHVAWHDERAGNKEIYYKRSVDNGETWGTDERLTHDPAHSWYPSVAVCDSIVHVVWVDEQDGNKEIYYKRSVDNGENWEADERLTNDPDGSRYPSVAVRDSIVHVVWQDYRDSNSEIYYKRSVDNGETWGIDERLPNVLAYSGYPSVAVCDSIVHVVWQNYRYSNWKIYYKRSIDDGETWGVDEGLTNDPAYSGYPSIAVCDSIVHVAWTDKRDGNQEIYYKRHKCEGGVNVEERNERLEIRDWRLEVCPNPVVGSAIIKYQLPVKSKISLKIYDITGRMIKTLVNKERSAGSYNVSFDAKGLTTGIYFAKLVAGDYKEIKKLILMK